MGKVTGGMTMSLDGFVTDKDGSLARLYPNLHDLRYETMLQEAIAATGAVIMGRRSYDMSSGDFTDYEYQVPIFVVTHHKPDTVAKGENEHLKINFVTDGFASAIQQAKAAAGDREVTIIGGVDTIQQCLKAGLIDELQVGIMPVLFGGGLRLFEHLENMDITLEKVRMLESSGGRTDIYFRVVK